MPVSIPVLKSRGVSSGDFKKIFTMEDAELPPKIQQLKQLINDRIREGYSNSLRDYRTYAAIDLAYSAPFNQTTPTLVQALLSKNLDAAGTMKELESWGLKKSDLFLEIDAGNNVKKYVLNPPIFFQIFIPIVKAYVTIRTAKLYNERNLSPLLPYTPLKNTPDNRVLCEVVTDIVETIATWYGYPSTLKEGIHQMLRYGVSLAFTKEEWHCEEQVNIAESGKEETVVTKEGLRYVFPHPTRMFYDLNSPLTTLNTDSGCEFIGHWRVMRYGDILDNRMYWNRSKIFYGTNWFASPLAGNYFQEVFPCQLAFPTIQSVNSSREERAVFYARNDRDKAVFVTEFYMKLIPSVWGLGDYKYPIWVHFTVAGDNSIIWAEPCAYCPGWFMGYDYDGVSGQTSSMALETIPWQDQLGNCLSQFILTAKQNLANVIYYDTQVVNSDDVEKLVNSGETKYRGMNFLPYDSLKTQRMGVNVKEAFQPIQLGYRDTSGMISLISTTLNMMERVLQMSAQETGGAATHQQSAREIAQTAGSVSQRVNFTGSYVDDAIDAWKRQLHAAFTAYLNPDFVAEVSKDIPNLNEVLEKLGLSKSHETRDTVVVSGKIGHHIARLEGFSRTGQGANQSVDKEQAQAFLQTIQLLSSNPALFQIVGAKNIISMIEFAAVLSGARQDFRLTVDEKGSAEQQQAQLQQQIAPLLEQFKGTMMQEIQKGLGQPVAQEIAKQEHEIQGMGQMLQKLQGIFQVAQQNHDAANIKAQETQQRMAQREQEHQQNLKQAQDKFNVEMQQLIQGAQVKLGIKQQEAMAESRIEHATNVSDRINVAFKDLADSEKAQVLQSLGIQPDQSGSLSADLQVKVELAAQKLRADSAKAGSAPKK
jgi:hypothetical protein